MASTPVLTALRCARAAGDAMATITSRPVMAILEITGSANLQDDNGTLLVACFGERAHNVAAPHGADCTV